MTTADRTAKLETILSRVTGCPVSITVRGERKFTISTETVTPDLASRVRSFFGDLVVASEDHDDECGSFVYIEAV